MWVWLKLAAEKRGGIRTMDNNAKKDYGCIFGVHLSVILFWYVTPFLFSWYWLLMGVVFSYAQGVVFNGCVLTHAQFGKENDDTFWGYYLRKLGVKLDKKTAKIIFFWIEPWAVLLIALVWQLCLGFKPGLF
jgi:hypothetical protein